MIAPDRAMDAALVPLTVEFHTQKRVTAVTVFIDNNPAPVVGTFRFGPAISPDQIKFRVRINDYTPVQRRCRNGGAGRCWPHRTM